jgi:tRNA-dihydrouridine synthase
MRLGWDEYWMNAPEIAERAEQIGIKAVTIHGRTRQQFFRGRADWRAVRAVKQAVRIPVIVNGDITDVASARMALEQSGADAVMIGRGSYGRPWLAASLDQALVTGGPLPEPGLAERLEILLAHLARSLTFYGDGLGLKVFRKHLGWYVENAPLTLFGGDALTRRAEKARLCQIDRAGALETALAALWSNPPLPILEPAPI